MYIGEKIKAGTVFTVRSLDWYNQFKNKETKVVENPFDDFFEFYEEMSKYCGQKVTVEEDCDIWNEIHLVEDQEYAWGSWMFVEFLDPFIEFAHRINKDIKVLEEFNFEGGISDGYHTFSSLYDIRKAYNAALFNEWADQKEEVHSPLEVNFHGEFEEIKNLFDKTHLSEPVRIVTDIKDLWKLIGEYLPKMKEEIESREQTTLIYINNYTDNCLVGKNKQPWDIVDDEDFESFEDFEDYWCDFLEYDYKDDQNLDPEDLRGESLNHSVVCKLNGVLYKVNITGDYEQEWFPEGGWYAAVYNRKFEHHKLTEVDISEVYGVYKSIQKQFYKTPTSKVEDKNKVDLIKINKVDFVINDKVNSDERKHIKRLLKKNKIRFSPFLFFNTKIRAKYNAHKSKRHYDGELCFGGGWFIVTAELPTGQISNHYKLEDWDLFKIPETEEALFEFDDHDTQDVIARLKNLSYKTLNQPHIVC